MLNLLPRLLHRGWPWWTVICLLGWNLGAALEGQTLQRRPSFQHVDLPPDFQTTQDLAMAQDDDGFLWFGGPSGLLRFDGYQMVPFDISGPHMDDMETACRYVNQVLPKGRFLWLATDCGVARLSLDDESLRHWPLREPSRLRTVVYRLAFDHAGWLWIGTTRGLQWLDPNGEPGSPMHNDDLLESLGESSITALHVDPDNTLWVGSADGLMRLAPDRTGAVDIPFTAPTTAPKHRLVEDILRDSTGQLWVTTGNGLRRLESTPAGQDHLRLDEDLAALCEKNPRQWFYQMANDAEGRLWISVGGNLVAWHPRGGTTRCFSRFDKSPKGLGGSVAKILVDDSGTVWAATERTLDRLPPNSFAAWTYSLDERVADYGWQTSWSASPLLDHEGHLWVGSNLGLFEIDLETYSLRRHFMADDPELLALLGVTTVGNLPDFTVLTLALGPDGSLWAGTAEGLARLPPGAEEFEDVPVVDASSPQPRIRSILPLKDRLWVGTARGLYALDIAQGTWTSLDLPHEVSPQPRHFAVRHLKADNSGRVWIGTPSHGLLVKESQNPHLTVPSLRFDAQPPSQESNVTHLGFGSSGELWVAYETEGLYRVDLQTLQASSPPWNQHLDGRYVTELVQVDRDLWLTTQMGLTQVRPGDTTASASAQLRHFSTRDGLENLATLLGLILTPDHRLLATGTSLFELDLTSLEEESLPPVRWTGLEVFNRRVRPSPGEASPLQRPMVSTEALQLGPQDSVFSLELSALGYAKPEHLTYFYRLEDIEPEWRETRPGQPFITYSHLPPGTYRLRARAALTGSPAPGQTTTEAILTLHLRPPWWQSVWAYAAYFLAATWLLWIFLASQRRKLAAEQQINRELRHVDRLKDEFLANTSHELRTPLFGITGLAEGLLEGSRGPVPKHLQGHLERIVSSGRRLSLLLDDLLDFARLRDAGARLNPRPVALHDLVAHVFELCSSRAEANQVVLGQTLSQDLPSLYVDPDRAQQVLRNLVDNGIKFSQGGRVEVHAHLEAEDMLRVEVRDNGTGIAKERQDAVFNLFEQGDGATTRQHGGTGLGLAMARRLVELQGGRIWLESASNEGCRVFFTVPTTRRPAEPIGDLGTSSVDADEPKPFSQSAGDGGGAPSQASTENQGGDPVARILVVDDEPVNQLILRGFLAEDRFRVSTADSGPRALEAMAEAPFDLVLLDVMMPEMSGFDVCRALRRDHPPETLPILFITAKDDLSDRLEGFEAGANDYLVKPIARAELLARVDRALQIARAYLQQHEELRR